MTNKPYRSFRRSAGFSLVELMIAGVIGLIVLLAVGSTFVASQKVNATASALTSVQENSRLAFELMSRDVREAGGNPCSWGLQIGNTLRTSTNEWWIDWERGLKGFDGDTATPGLAFGSTVGTRKEGTDAIDIYAAYDGDANVVEKMPISSAEIQVTSNSNFQKDDLVMVCDTAAAFIFQITQVNAGPKIQHNSGSGSPGNCSKAFDYSNLCSNADDGYTFGKDAVVARLSSYRWYIGANERGGNSLWRAKLTNLSNGNIPTIEDRQEIARGVDDMMLLYYQGGQPTYQPASSVTDWKSVVAVQIALDVQQQMDGARQAGVGGDGKTLVRPQSHTVALRNR